jgi:hypothetical protein
MIKKFGQYINESDSFELDEDKEIIPIGNLIEKIIKKDPVLNMFYLNSTNFPKDSRKDWEWGDHYISGTKETYYKFTYYFDSLGDILTGQIDNNFLKKSEQVKNLFEQLYKTFEGLKIDFNSYYSQTNREIIQYLRIEIYKKDLENHPLLINIGKSSKTIKKFNL